MKLLWELPVFRSNVVGVKTKGFFFCVLILSFKAKIKESFTILYLLVRTVASLLRHTCMLLPLTLPL